MPKSETSPMFDTNFGMLHSLTLLEKETRQVLSEATHHIDCVASGLVSGELPAQRAVELLRQAAAALRKLSG